MVLWVGLRSFLARPQHGHVFPQGSCSWRAGSELTLEVTSLVLLIRGCTQQLSGRIWNILPSHMGLLFLKPTLLVGNMERKEGVSCAAQ